MNTVSDLQRGLAEEVERLKAPGGLEGRVLEALRTSSAQAVLRANAADRRSHTWLQRPHGQKVPSRPPRFVALVAALIAIIVIVTLVYSIQALRPPRTMPSNAPRPGTVSIPIPTPKWTWFFSSNDAAVLSDVVDPKNPGGVLAERLLITHDGGQNWLATRVPAIVGGPMVNWIDATHIVYVAESGIETTNDGGLNWTATQVNSPVKGPLWSTYFLTTSEGWALEGNSVYRLADSGANWQKLASLGPGPTTPFPQLLFTDPLHGFMAGTSSDGVGRYFQTSDGGQTWHLLVLPKPAGGWPLFASTVGVPTLFGSRGVIQLGSVGAVEYVYFTSDGGATWSDPRLLSNAAGVPVFIDTKNGWVVDGGGREYRTSDGGATWKQFSYTIRVGYTLEGITPVTVDTIWGVAQLGYGGASYVVKSSDGGSTWSFVKEPAT